LSVRTSEKSARNSSILIHDAGQPVVINCIATGQRYDLFILTVIVIGGSFSAVD